MPLLDPIEHMRIDDESFLELIDAIERAEHELFAHPLHGSAKLNESYARCVRMRKLRLEMGKVQPLQAGASLIEGAEDDARALAMHRALVRLEYVSAEGVLLLKGRAACCIEGADELLATEILSRGVLQGLGIQETAALLTCLLPSMRGGGSGPPSVDSPSPLPLPTAALTRAVLSINETGTMVSEVLAECGVGAGDEEAQDRFGRDGVSVELIPAVMAWAGGASFEKAWLLSPSTYEGTLVRCLRALDEMLKQLAQAAAALGDVALSERFGLCGAQLHRGIAFSSSLYM